MMSKLITTIKATLTRIMFSAHSLIAVWQVTQNKRDPIYWTLCGPIVLLIIEGLFTLAIKKNQEWRWFCPSVFLYLGSVVPAIWLLELEKVEKRLKAGKEEQVNVTIPAGKELGINLQIQIDAQTWTTLIEQFLMLILIIGRWLLPKGDLTRDQLSQLLLVYIGTAADIIEFFDSYKDDSIAKVPLLVYLTLGIWSWSLLQFTIVLSATRSRKSRGGGTSTQEDDTDCCNDCCCGIDIWGIALNVILQDAPFLAFRLLIIIHYRIINYMNVFFTCKNTLVILLQLYRLYVVNSEYWKAKRELKRTKGSSSKYKKVRKRYDNDYEDQSHDIYIISSGKLEKSKKQKRSSRSQIDESDEEVVRRIKPHKGKHKKHTRKDTGYSTASSQNTCTIQQKQSQTKIEKPKARKKDKKSKSSSRKSSSSDGNESDIDIKKKKRKDDGKRNDNKKHSRKNKRFESVKEESDSGSESPAKYEVVNEKSAKKKKRTKLPTTSSSSSNSSSSQ